MHLHGSGCRHHLSACTCMRFKELGGDVTFLQLQAPFTAVGALPMLSALLPPSSSQSSRRIQGLCW